MFQSIFKSMKSGLLLFYQVRIPKACVAFPCPNISKFSITPSNMYRTQYPLCCIFFDARNKMGSSFSNSIFSCNCWMFIKTLSRLTTVWRNRTEKSCLDVQFKVSASRVCSWPMEGCIPLNFYGPQLLVAQPRPGTGRPLGVRSWRPSDY